MATLRDVGRWSYLQLASGAGQLLGEGSGCAAGILAFHRIAPRGGQRPAATWNVPPQRFRQQIEGLLRRGFHAWPLRLLLDANAANAPCPQRAFVVTFDDGYESVFRYAWPVLRELGVPATVFLATAYVDSGQPFPFDDWPLAGADSVPAEHWRPLSTAQCRAMQASGLIELGTHTHWHRVYRGAAASLTEDLKESLRFLHERFGQADATFAFPHGKTDSALLEAARSSGVLCALTMRGERIRLPRDPFGWGRFDITERDTVATIAARLNGWYGLGQTLWRGLRSVDRVPSA